MRTWRIRLAVVCACGAGAGLSGSCAGSATPPEPTATAGSTGGGAKNPTGSMAGTLGAAGTGTSGTAAAPPAAPPSAFPARPVLVSGVPRIALQVFALPDDPSGPTACLTLPEIHGAGALYPNNWLPPRFVFALPPQHNVAEIRVSTASQSHELRVYTTESEWRMPQEVWNALVPAAMGEPIGVSLRTAAVGSPQPSGPTLAALGQIQVAPVKADGSIIFWDIAPGGGVTAFRGFEAGTKKVRTLVRDGAVSRQTTCIGCHATTPDGQFIAFTHLAGVTQGQITFANLQGAVADPLYLSTTAKSLLARGYQSIPSFSPAHFATGDRIMLSMWEQSDTKTDLLWTNLEDGSGREGQNWGVIARTGDLGQPSGADFSPDGTQIVYASGADVNIGITTSAGNLHLVPYNDRMGGVATPIPGASEPDYNEFMPSFSPDGSLIAYARVPNPKRSDNEPSAEVFVVPSAGGQAMRLSANDPPACTGATSPGSYNTWPKWAPKVGMANGRRYYWIVFSSGRLQPLSDVRQLFIAGLVEENGTLMSYGAIHLWNQNQQRLNLEPSWADVRLGPP